MINLSTLANWAQMISIPVAIVAIAASIWIYRRSQRTRSLTCIFDPVSSLLEVRAGNALEGEIEIRYNKQAVENLFIVRASLKNTGNEAIRKSDVVEPVAFVFSPDAKLLREPQIIGKKPNNLSVDWKLHRTGRPPRTNAASFNFELLNPNDELMVEFLCTGQSSIPEVTARIEGIARLEVIDPGEVRLRKELAKLWSAPGILMLILLIGFNWIILQMVIQIWQEVPGWLAFVFGPFILIAMIMLWINVLRPAFDLAQYRRRKKTDET